MHENDVHCVAGTEAHPPIVSEFAASVEHLAVTIDSLYSRLEPALRPNMDPPSDCLTAERPIQSDIRAVLVEVHRQTDRLHALRDRLEV